jgi:hypothetical protein
MEPRWNYDIPVEFLRDQAGFNEFKSLLTLYSACFGRFYTYLFNDLGDNSVTDQLIGIGDGTTRQFYLARTFAGLSQRIAGAALIGTPVFKVAGSTAVGTTFDAYGVVTFTVAPAFSQAVTWTGGYYWICRFDEDQLNLAEFADRWWECKSVKFSTEIIT